MIQRIFSFLFLLCCLTAAKALEVAHAITDKDCYLTGERLHIRIDITDEQQQPLSFSKVAYVELSDAHRICAQGMVQLTDGIGWADIALPATMHSGNYQLSVYTRGMRNQGQDTYFRKIVSVVNVLRVVRADDVIFLPADSLPTEYQANDSQGTATLKASVSQPLNISVSPEWQGCALSVSRRDLRTPDYHELPALKPETSKQQYYTPEVEGHIVIGKPTGIDPVELTRLVMVGRMAAVYDGQWQADGTWHYYTSGLNGTLPTLLNSYSHEGNPVGMEFVSPFARVLPESLPHLHVYCDEADLQRRSLSAQREQALSAWQADSLQLSTEFLSAETHRQYELDEYTKFSTVREILIEFISGVQRNKQHGVSQLYTFDPETHQYSRWPALVLLDGMPVYDIDEVLNYDARLLKYVQIYTDRYTFGNTICQGIISFISQRGRLSNYKIDAGSHLVTYQFPQERPAFIYPTDNKAGTLYWNPCISEPSLTLPAITEPGIYEIVKQRYAADGSLLKESEVIEVK